jgi:hypothetical protein
VPIKGYSFMGKRGRVERMVLTWDGLGYFDLKIYAAVLKLDGTDSRSVASWGAVSDHLVKNALDKNGIKTRSLLKPTKTSVLMK